MAQTAHPLASVCVYCGSSDLANPAYLEAAGQFGALLAAGGVRLVYGGGGVGLMGACARGAHASGGRVLGVMPQFLQSREGLYGAVETVIVANMHERKQMMFEQSDGFAVLPGGIGTLEEVIELMSWRRLNLHAKPVVFYSPDGFWKPLFALIEHTVRENLTPTDFLDSYAAVDRVEDILPSMAALMSAQPQAWAAPALI